LAEKMGFAIGEYHEFKKLGDGVKFLKDRKDLWVFKPENNQALDLTYVEKFPGEIVTKIRDEWTVRIGDKCDFVLQKKIDGAEVSSEVWVGPDGPVHYNHTFESKRLMTGNLGPAIGSQSNTVWIGKDTGTLIEPLTKMAAYLRSKGYLGPCDANCIVKGNVPYFLEWSPRFGYDAIYCLLKLLKGSLADFFLKDFKAEFHSGYACSQRISIPPYPYAIPTLRRVHARDVSIMNELERIPFFWGQDIYADPELKVAGADGIIGIVTARDENLEAAWGKVYSAIGKLKVCSYLQYRTDGFKEHAKRVKELKIA
jgi:phosphoribosylamine-glycine ligase